MALEVVKTEYSKLGIRPSTVTYRGLIRMHILAKDIDAALKLKDEMIKDHNMVPDAESYGWLIRSCGHRDLLVEGLQLLEEVSERGSAFALPFPSFYSLCHTAVYHTANMISSHSRFNRPLPLHSPLSFLGIKVQERHLQHLRARCATLGIVHPNMPADPLQWVADMKKLRKDSKNRSQRKMNSVRSALYGK
jgi:pentatricopeptide repeat protein